MKYQPKGSMCANCTKKNDDCSKLDFSKMRPIDTFATFESSEPLKPMLEPLVTIVKCTEFKRDSTTQ